MIKLTPQLLMSSIGCRADVADRWTHALVTAMGFFHIDFSSRRMAAFLAQIGYESSLLTVTAENLNYSAERLMQIFPAKFNPSTAAAYARKPISIANRVYANRLGNGAESSGDGWRYRGQGPIQLTFKDNYRAAGQGIGVDLVANPDLIQVPRNGAMVSAWYWNSRSCNELADAGDMEAITRAINGGMNGYDERLELYKRASAVLG